jgi:hypothetical protein
VTPFRARTWHFALERLRAEQAALAERKLATSPNVEAWRHIVWCIAALHGLQVPAWVGECPDSAQPKKEGS